MVDLPFAPYPGLTLFLSFTDSLNDINMTSIFTVETVEYNVRSAEFTCMESFYRTTESEEQVRDSMAFEGFAVWT
jgi:hypothetical protein